MICRACAPASPARPPACNERRHQIEIEDFVDRLVRDGFGLAVPLGRQRRTDRITEIVDENIDRPAWRAVASTSAAAPSDVVRGGTSAAKANGRACSSVRPAISARVCTRRRARTGCNSLTSGSERGTLEERPDAIVGRKAAARPCVSEAVDDAIRHTRAGRAPLIAIASVLALLVRHVCFRIRATVELTPLGNLPGLRRDARVDATHDVEERYRALRSTAGAVVEIVHVPAGYDNTRPIPLVLNFHGATMTAALQQRTTGMDAKADEAGSWSCILKVSIDRGTQAPAVAKPHRTISTTSDSHARSSRTRADVSASIPTGSMQPDFRMGDGCPIGSAAKAADLFAAIAPVAGTKSFPDPFGVSSNRAAVRWLSAWRAERSERPVMRAAAPRATSPARRTCAINAIAASPARSGPRTYASNRSPSVSRSNKPCMNRTCSSAMR
jgi:hypothetical protein